MHLSQTPRPKPHLIPDRSRHHEYNHAHEAANSGEGEKLLAYLEDLFDAADLDHSGTLEPTEIVALLKDFYRAQKMSRSSKKIYRLVLECLDDYNMDPSGMKR